VVNFTTVACRVSSRLKWYKNYKHQLRLAKVMVKNKMSRFFGSLCRIPLNEYKAVKQSVATASANKEIDDRTVNNSLRCTLRAVLFLSRPRSGGWPHHGRTFSIYLYPLSFWLTVPQRVLSTTWCCLSRQCMVFLVCVHYFFLQAIPLFPRGVTIVCQLPCFDSV